MTAGYGPPRRAARPLRIGFDGRLLAHDTTPTGVGTYARELLKHLAAMTDVEMIVLSDRPFDPALSRTPAVIIPKLPVLPWQQTSLVVSLLRGKVAAYHSPSFTLPLLSPCPTVATVHDLSFIRFPDTVDDTTRRYLTHMVPISVRRAAAVIVPSLLVQDEVATTYRVQRERIWPVPLGVDPSRWHRRPNREIADYTNGLGLTSPYLLFVGSFGRRKNLLRLLRAFRGIARERPSHKLILAGPSTPSSELSRELERTGNVECLPYVPANDLPLLVQGADALCYVSVYEGFGLPVLEAMAVGTPAIVATGTSMSEFATTAVYVDPQDVDDIASGLLSVTDLGSLRDQLAAESVIAASQYTWAVAAHRTVDVYSSVARR